jgi:hypothetical protein
VADKRTPKLALQLHHAIEWISRSRSSSTQSERFICLWIAIEYLVLRGSEASRDDAILGALQSRVAPLMARGNRDLRKYWNSIVEDCYRLRCDVVHEAKEDDQQLARLVPLIGQAAFEVVWYCAAVADKAAADRLPADLLEDLAKPPGMGRS